MAGESRGRLTPPDIVFAGVAALLLVHFAPALISLLNDHAPSMSPGTVYVFELLVPAMIMTVLSVVYLTSTGGA